MNNPMPELEEIEMQMAIEAEDTGSWPLAKYVSLYPGYADELTGFFIGMAELEAIDKMPEPVKTPEEEAESEAMFGRVMQRFWERVKRGDIPS